MIDHATVLMAQTYEHMQRENGLMMREIKCLLLALGMLKKGVREAISDTTETDGKKTRPSIQKIKDALGVALTTAELLESGTMEEGLLDEAERKVISDMSVEFLNSKGIELLA